MNVILSFRMEWPLEDLNESISMYNSISSTDSGHSDLMLICKNFAENAFTKRMFFKKMLISVDLIPFHLVT
jgi:hypothetical protein